MVGKEEVTTKLGKKPPYRVPSMAEIATIKLNGFTVASTFSGCGGSCLGYRMAGYRVLYANEFVPEARASYSPNHPSTYLDPRDIRKVRPGDVLKACRLKAGELDLFDGSPPCQSFSTAGKREKGWGIAGDHADGSKQVSDDLFFEYARLLRGIQPKTFVAENVSGLVKGVAKGYFKLILKELRSCGYIVEARVLDAQWLGVPQCRQRVIFVGVRNDLGLAPAFPSPMPYRYSVMDACPWIGRCIIGNDAFQPKFGRADVPTPTLMAGGSCGSSRLVEVVREPELVVSTGRSKGRRFTLRKPSPTVTCGSVGGMGGSVSLEEPSLVSISGMGKGRRRSQRSPSPCVMAGGITDGKTRRKFTISEVRRLCSFPDDFVLVGSFAQQWARMGNSVPPLMMKAIAETIRDRVLLPLQR